MAFSGFFFGKRHSFRFKSARVGERFTAWEGWVRGGGSLSLWHDGLAVWGTGTAAGH